MIALCVAFKKKFARVCLALVLVVGLFAITPDKSFADQTLSITPSVNVDADQPAEITITNNQDYAVSVKGFEIINNQLPADST